MGGGRHHRDHDGRGPRRRPGHPELEGRLDGAALRVPVVDGSVVDLAVLLETQVTRDEVNAVFEEAGRSGALHERG
nr:hypothetical protein [Nocardioides rubriscoriae]